MVSCDKLSCELRQESLQSIAQTVPSSVSLSGGIDPKALLCVGREAAEAAFAPLGLRSHQPGRKKCWAGSLAPCRLWRQWCCLLSMCTPTFSPSGAPGLSPGSLGEAAVPGTPALLGAGHGNALITPWAVVLLPNSFTPKITAALPCPAGRRPARFRSTISRFIHFIQIFHVQAVKIQESVFSEGQQKLPPLLFFSDVTHTLTSTKTNSSTETACGSTQLQWSLPMPSKPQHQRGAF